MNWEPGQRYRFKAVRGEGQIEKIASTGTPSAHVMCEVTSGPMMGRRLRFRGYLNSTKNAETTLAELRVMGWRGKKLGDWSGLDGSAEFEGAAMAEVGSDGKTYWRLAWPRQLATVNAKNAVGGGELDALNASLGALLTKPSEALPPAPVPGSAEEQEEISFP